MAPNSEVRVGKVVFSNPAPLALIAGPCQMQSREHAFMVAGRLKEMTGRLGIGFVFKASFDKANRTSALGARGLGLEKALPVFADLRRELDVAVLTDVHEPGQCAEVAEVADVLQIPAFLVPADRPSGRGRAYRTGGEHQEGPVPRPLGYGATWWPRSPAPATPTCW